MRHVQTTAHPRSSILRCKRSGRRIYPIIVVMVVLVSAGGVWLLFPINIRCSATGEKKGIIDLPYHEVRTQLVRSKIDEIVFQKCGIELLERELVERDVDLSRDPNPFRNAIARKSLASIYQKEHVTLEVPHNTINSSTVKLAQVARIGPTRFVVCTCLISPTGLLENYDYEVIATPKGLQTEVSFKMQAKIETQVFAFCKPWAQSRLDQGLAEQLTLQSTAFLTSFKQRNVH